MKKRFVLGLAILFVAGLFMTACVLGNQTDGLTAHKETAKATLTAYVEALNQDDYSEENWAAIKGIANTGKSNIRAAINKTGVNAALNTALKDIHLVDYEGRDFVLTISVGETTWITNCMIQEDFRVTGELKNISGKDHEVVFGIFRPYIPGKDWDVNGGVWEHLKYPPVLLFKSDNIRPLAFSLDPFGKISLGDHQLTARGGVFLGWEQPIDPDKPITWEDFDTAQRIDVSSNTVVLTVKP